MVDTKLHTMVMLNNMVYGCNVIVTGANIDKTFSHRLYNLIVEKNLVVVKIKTHPVNVS